MSGASACIATIEGPDAPLKSNNLRRERVYRDD
jgi:hypothetical protein